MYTPSVTSTSGSEIISYPGFGQGTGTATLSFPDPRDSRIEKLYRLLNMIGKQVNPDPIIRELLQLHGYTPADIEQMLVRRVVVT